MMKEAEAHLDVIAVGAHPDDVEIACGGTLAALANQGYRVGIIDLTDGEPTPLCPSPEVRRAEANSAANALGIHLRKILDFTNRRLMDHFEIRVALATEFRRYRPKIVLGLGRKTPMASPDHHQAMLITDAAVFYSRLTKWEEYFPDLPPHTISSQVYYHLSFDAMEPPESGHRFTVDITETLPKKIESIRCYQSQFPPSKQGLLDRVSALASVHGLAAGFGAGEIFYSVKPIGMVDLVEGLLPGHFESSPR